MTTAVTTTATTTAVITCSGDLSTLPLTAKFQLMDSLGLGDIEAVVALFLNRVRLTPQDTDTTIDARVSGIDWVGISDLYPVNKVIVLVGRTSGTKRPIIFTIQEEQ